MRAAWMAGKLWISMHEKEKTILIMLLIFKRRQMCLRSYDSQICPGETKFVPRDFRLLVKVSGTIRDPSVTSNFMDFPEPQAVASSESIFSSLLCLPSIRCYSALWESVATAANFQQKLDYFSVKLNFKLPPRNN